MTNQSTPSLRVSETNEAIYLFVLDCFGQSPRNDDKVVDCHDSALPNLAMTEMMDYSA